MNIRSHSRSTLRLTVAVALCLLGARALAAQTDAVAVLRNVMVPMRDGVRLATDIYLPAREGAVTQERLPAILIRTPYGKDERYAGTASYFATHGYAAVVEDVRGRYHSEGVWRFLNDDGRDGYDVCEWIARQSWSNGRIGMWGGSYDGGVQHAAALEGTPHLTTVIPLDAVSNMGYAGMRNGGAFELRFWNWIYFLGLPGSHEAQADAHLRAMFEELAANRKLYLPDLPLRRGTTPLKFAPEYESWLIEAMRHGAADDYWQQVDILDHADRYKDLPVYLVGGWYDSWAGNTTANYALLSRKIKGPVYLIMGPWTHGGQGRFAHGQVTFGREAAIPDTLAWQQEWYDHWLKGVDNSVGRRAPFATPVRIFVMGTGDGRKDAEGRLNHGGYWREEQEWPLARTQYTKFYLHRGGELSTQPPAEANSSTSYQFDPRDPVPTIGGNISSHNDLLLQGAWNQRGNPQVWNYTQPVPLSARRDVLVFQTEPLAADTEVTGELTVTLYASSSAPDTDFTAKLIDVYPSSADFPAGFDLNLEDGIIRARFRDSLKVERLMRPGEVYKFTIKLYPTSNVFKRGHRIRLDISSSNFPRFDVNPNTGEPLGDNRLVATAVNTVYHDAAHASFITLPLIPAQAGNKR